ncbi:hypothetical protein Tco_0997035 [Tanacetum coccineum]
MEKCGIAKLAILQLGKIVEGEGKVYPRCRRDAGQKRGGKPVSWLKFENGGKRRKFNSVLLKIIGCSTFSTPLVSWCPSCGYVEKGMELVKPCHPPGFPVFFISDIAMGNIHTTGCSRINKVLNGVLQCSIWAIWKLRNRVINVEPDMVRKVKDEDIFPFIRRTSKLWISVRLNLAAANWNRWISRPYDILSSV